MRLRSLSPHLYRSRLSQRAQPHKGSAQSRVGLQEHAPMEVVIAAQLPPPVNGLSTVNMRIAEALGERASAQITDLSPAPGASGARKYAGRLAQALKATRTLWACGRSERRVLYMPSDGGIGMVAN